MDKAKAGSSGGLTNHIDRTQEQTSENIDKLKSHENFELVEKTGTIDWMIKERLKEFYQGTKAIRKDAVTSQRFILSGSHDSMAELSRLQLMQWAADSYKFFEKKYSKGNIIRATVHMDERTPHMHLITVPLTQDGRLSAKEFTGSKEKLQQLQTDYANEVGAKYGLERGLKNSNRKHITTKDYYQYINSNDLTAEKIVKHEHAKELVSKLIEEADKGKGLEHLAEKNRILKDKEYGREISKRPEQSKERGEQKKPNDRGFSLSM